MLALGSGDVWVAAGGAFAAVFATALAVKTKLGLGWIARKIKDATKRAFAEAIDEQVRPEFEKIRQNTVSRADEIKAEALAAADDVREKNESNVAALTEALRVHTVEEGEIVRAVVQEEIAPIVVTLTRHMDHDEQMTQLAKQALIGGQDTLIARMDEKHDALVAMINEVRSKVETAADDAAEARAADSQS